MLAEQGQNCIRCARLTARSLGIDLFTHAQKIIARSFDRRTRLDCKIWSLVRTRQNCGFKMEATPPATPRHTMFPLWLLPSGSDQVHG